MAASLAFTADDADVTYINIITSYIMLAVSCQMYSLIEEPFHAQMASSFTMQR